MPSEKAKPSQTNLKRISTGELIKKFGQSQLKNKLKDNPAPKEDFEKIRRNLRLQK